jgi:uncharacterized protein (TIGR02453 family)
MHNISTSTLQFLKDLKANNDRDWFNTNKSRYEAAHREFLQFTDALIAEISAFDPAIAYYTAKDCVFRIYRDIRFSKDKSPYKTHFGAHVTAATKKSEIHTRAGYYLHLEPGATMLAGGAYMPESKWLKAIRQEIAYNTEEFNSLLNNGEFKIFFGEMEGEKLKTAPKEYPADHPAIGWLKHKSFLATHFCTDEQVLSSDFLKHCASVFRALQPFDQFLNRSTD